MTRDDIFLMLRARRDRLEQELRVLNYGRHEFGSGDDGLVERAVRATKREIAMLARMIDGATDGEP